MFIIALVEVNIEIDEELKSQAEQLFAELGMDLSTAVYIFLRQVVRCGGIPFDIRTDADTTEEQYSGEIELTLPQSLYRELAKDAEREGVSINELCIYRLSRNTQLANLKTDESYSFIRGAKYYDKGSHSEDKNT